MPRGLPQGSGILPIQRGAQEETEQASHITSRSVLQDADSYTGQQPVEDLCSPQQEAPPAKHPWEDSLHQGGCLATLTEPLERGQHWAFPGPGQVWLQ